MRSKNIRCFPCCCTEAHYENTFCGNNVELRIQCPSHWLNGHEIPDLFVQLRPLLDTQIPFRLFKPPPQDFTRGDYLQANFVKRVSSALDSASYGNLLYIVQPPRRWHLSNGPASASLACCMWAFAIYRGICIGIQASPAFTLHPAAQYSSPKATGKSQTQELERGRPTGAAAAAVTTTTKTQEDIDEQEVLGLLMTSSSSDENS